MERLNKGRIYIEDIIKESKESNIQKLTKKEVEKLKEIEETKKVLKEEDYGIISKLSGKGVNMLLDEIERISKGEKGGYEDGLKMDGLNKEEKERVESITKVIRGISKLKGEIGKKVLSIMGVIIIGGSVVSLGGCSSPYEQGDVNQVKNEVGSSKVVSEREVEKGGEINVRLIKGTIHSGDYEDYEGIGSYSNENFGVQTLSVNSSGQEEKIGGISVEMFFKNYTKDIVKIEIKDVQIDNIRYEDKSGLYDLIEGGETNNTSGKAKTTLNRTLVIEDTDEVKMPKSPQELKLRVKVSNNASGKKLGEFKMVIDLTHTNVFN